MSSRTLWILLALVLLLGGLGWWLGQREQGQAVAVRRNLFPGLEPQSIQAFRIDNIERGLQMRIERREQGWTIVDPVEYPADPSVLVRLVDDVTRLPAEPVPDPDLEKLGLRPRPRVVLEVEQGQGEGVRVRRLELGMPDLDGRSVFARVEGEVVRTLRNIDTTLERDLPDWRSRRLLSLAPATMGELHRRGAYAFEEGGAEVDLTLDAVLDDLGWRATAPRNLLLDPARIGSLIRKASQGIAVHRFRDDRPASLEPYGLDQPDLVIELATFSGARETLRFAELTRGQWMARIDGRPNVYEIERMDVEFLLRPLEGMVDERIVLAAREEIDAIRLVARGRELRLWKRGIAWFAQESRSGEEGARVLADPDRVADLLGAIDGARAIQVLFDEPMPHTLIAEGLWVESRGRTFGGRLGPPHETPEGGRGVLFQREADGLVMLVDEQLAEWARAPLERMRSRELHRVDELEVSRATVTLAGEERRSSFVRDGRRGRWTREGVNQEARDFALLVDRLLLQRAARFLDAGGALELVDAVEVQVVHVSGRPVSFRLGRVPEGASPLGAVPGEVVYEGPDVRAVVEGSLHEGLVELLRE